MARQTAKASAKVINKGTASLMLARDSFIVITECLKYLGVREEEITRRAYIAAQRDTLVAAITAERDLITTYFAYQFTERRAALDQLFTILQQGVAEHDSTVIDRSLTGILGILQDNPLQDIEAFRTNWRNPDFVIDL